MSNHIYDETEAFEKMESCRLAPPSEALKRRVMVAAQEAWTPLDSSAQEIPWGMPVLRFAASIAVAGLFVVFAMGVDKRAMESWQSVATPVRQRGEAGSAYRVSWLYAGISTRSVSSVPASHVNAAQGLSERLRQTRELLRAPDTLDG